VGIIFSSPVYIPPPACIQIRYRKNEIVHFKPKNSEKLCSAVTDVAQQHAPTLLPAAQTVADKFREVFSLFGACHSVYDSAKMLEEAKVDDLGKYIKLQYQLQINKVTP